MSSCESPWLLCFIKSKILPCTGIYAVYSIYIYMYQKYIKTTGNIYCKTIVSYTVYSSIIGCRAQEPRRIDPPEPPLGMSRFLPLFLGLCHKVACRAYCKYAMRISKLMSGHVMKMWIAGLSEHLKIKELIWMFWAVSLDMEKKQHTIHSAKQDISRNAVQNSFHAKLDLRFPQNQKLYVEKNFWHQDIPSSLQVPENSIGNVSAPCLEKRSMGILSKAQSQAENDPRSC